MLDTVGAVPFVVYLVVYPLVVGRVTVTVPFVQPDGVKLDEPIVGILPKVISIVPLVALFPATSYTSAYAWYVPFDNPSITLVAFVTSLLPLVVLFIAL